MLAWICTQISNLQRKRSNSTAFPQNKALNSILATSTYNLLLHYCRLKTWVVKHIFLQGENKHIPFSNIWILQVRAVCASETWMTCFVWNPRILVPTLRTCHQVPTNLHFEAAKVVLDYPLVFLLQLLVYLLSFSLRIRKNQQLGEHTFK